MCADWIVSFFSVYWSRDERWTIVGAVGSGLVVEVGCVIHIVTSGELMWLGKNIVSLFRLSFCADDVSWGCSDLCTEESDDLISGLPRSVWEVSAVMERRGDLLESRMVLLVSLKVTLPTMKILFRAEQFSLQPLDASG